MPEFVIMLYAPAPADLADMPPEELAAHERHGAEAEELGVKLLAGYALEASTTARTVRGETITDGPFADTPEVLSGFMVIAARDADHALEVAKRSPGTIRGAVEIRPLL
ncbi:YciI family protein [Kribbella catacumbae]|uniref:YciI family protein n=1 Tax=Kribbella catacumbae TaxID=460086 RepID=UPI00035FFD71|nr:YciI family protein [Kribbella catacumbae]